MRVTCVRNSVCFLCRDILASDAITDEDECDDTTKERMRRYYFGEEEMVDNKIVPPQMTPVF